LDVQLLGVPLGGGVLDRRRGPRRGRPQADELGATSQAIRGLGGLVGVTGGTDDPERRAEKGGHERFADCRSAGPGGSTWRSPRVAGDATRDQFVACTTGDSYDFLRHMLRLNDILTRVSSYHPDADLDIIKKAYVYSAKVHQGQLRKSGEPYLVHPLEVAGILAELKLDEAS